MPTIPDHPSCRAGWACRQNDRCPLLRPCRSCRQWRSDKASSNSCARHYRPAWGTQPDFRQFNIFDDCCARSAQFGNQTLPFAGNIGSRSLSSRAPIPVVRIGQITLDPMRQSMHQIIGTGAFGRLADLVRRFPFGAKHQLALLQPPKCLKRPGQFSGRVRLVQTRSHLFNHGCILSLVFRVCSCCGNRPFTAVQKNRGPGADSEPLKRLVSINPMAMLRVAAWARRVVPSFRYAFVR